MRESFDRARSLGPELHERKRRVIIGSGLIARAFAPHAGQLGDVCIYAAGVSNSSCSDAREFAREHQRLGAALRDAAADTLFVYFSTCSVADPDAQASGYVRHKLAMEDVTRQHARHLILRLPQLAGETPNPHTLLNYLFARIVRSERFQIWARAKRNIIDVDDVARIALDLIDVEHAAGETINVASPHSSGMVDIVRSMEQVLGHRAIFDAVERGSSYAIDTQRIAGALQRCGISFPETYLHTVIGKYYGHRA